MLTIHPSSDAALIDIQRDRLMIASGGVGLPGQPIQAPDVKHLTLVRSMLASAKVAAARKGLFKLVTLVGYSSPGSDR